MEITIKNKEQSSEWLTPGDKRVIKYAAFAGSTVIIGGVVFFTARHFYRKNRAGNAQTQSLNDGTPENYAKRIKMAFDNDGWWGTDVEALRRVFIEIPSQEEFSTVVSKYEALTKGSKGSFYVDLTKALTTSEYYEMSNILKGKPKKKGEKAVFDWNAAYAMSHRIKASFDYTILGLPATDKGALEAALREIPTLLAYAMVAVAYKKEYGTELEDDLNSELDIFDFSWKDIVYTKPKK
jgi:hypothetical protein